MHVDELASVDVRRVEAIAALRVELQVEEHLDFERQVLDRMVELLSWLLDEVPFGGS